MRRAEEQAIGTYPRLRIRGQYSHKHRKYQFITKPVLNIQIYSLLSQKLQQGDRKAITSTHLHSDWFISYIAWPTFLLRSTRLHRPSGLFPHLAVTNYHKRAPNPLSVDKDKRECCHPATLHTQHAPLTLAQPAPDLCNAAHEQQYY